MGDAGALRAEVVHSLGATVVALAVVLGGVAIGRARRRMAARRRVVALLGPWAGSPSEPGSRRWASWSGRIRKAAPVVGAGIAGFLLVGGAAGCGVGIACACGTWRWLRGRREQRSGAELSAEEAAWQLPFAADLLAACLAAGAGPRRAAEAVGGALGGPVGERLAQAAAEVRLGGEPATAWGRLTVIPGATPLARCLERAQATGVPAVEPMARLAERLRAEQARAAGTRARRAGVLATAPLGLCFLPAFLTVGVVPVVIGLASGLLNGR
ncbi:type II secretion system F family protein [Streptomyces sp. NPDC049577]|uniref:type II secretion system F family protein n=1 Tax=Streptomyces sp. NPDC049577 TaxID=3155153 RepID=UPI00343289AF